MLETMENAKEYMGLHEERKSYLNAYKATADNYYLEMANSLLAEMIWLYS